jgi:photosystem II stability/assembly factor-like uncharacterized protein
MKSAIILLTFLLLFSTESVYSQSGWKWISPYPHGNTIYSIAPSGNCTYFLASKSTLSVSRDTGNTEDNLVTYSKTSTATGRQQSLAFLDSLNGFLIDPLNGEFRTTDAGRSWKQTLRTEYFAVTFADSKTGWEIGSTGIAGATNIVKTTDGGVSWFQQNITSWPSDEYLNGIYVLDSLNVWITSSNFNHRIGSLYHSSDGGKSWSVQATGLSADTSKQMHLSTPRINKSGLGILIASVYVPNNPDSRYGRSIILRTENSGKTWAAVDSSVEGNLSNVISVNDSIWIIQGNGENDNNMTVQYRSTDFGKTFSGGNILTPGNSNNFFSASAYNPRQKVLFLSTYNELFRSLDLGITYSSVSSEKSLECFDFSLDNSVSDKQLAAAVSNRKDRFLLSHDGGRTWQMKPLSIPNEDTGWMKGVQVSGGTICVFTTEYIYTYNDNGELRSYFYFPSRPSIFPSAYSGQNYLVLTDTYSSEIGYKPEMRYTNDGGKYWDEVPIPPNYKFNSVKLIGPKEIIGCGSCNDSSGNNGFIFASSNGGADWRIIRTKEAFRDICMVTGSFGYGFSEKKIYTTEDNWRTIKASYYLNSSEIIEALNFPDSAHGIMRTYKCFYETFDMGKSWHQSGIDMPMFGNIRKMLYNNQGDFLVLGYNGFIMKLSEKTSQNSAGQNDNIHKMSYELFQNYPNPFNPATQITFRLSEKGQVELKVFDMLGREVKTLLDEVKDAGTYSVPFNAAELPSGIYISRLKAGSEVMVRKMLLLK